MAIMIHVTKPKRFIFGLIFNELLLSAAIFWFPRLHHSVMEFAKSCPLTLFRNSARKSNSCRYYLQPADCLTQMFSPASFLVPRSAAAGS